jgi:hypothetical protein
VPKENESKERTLFLPQECPRQKVFFYPDGCRDKNRHEKLIMNAILILAGAFHD